MNVETSKRGNLDVILLWGFEIDHALPPSDIESHIRDVIAPTLAGTSDVVVCVGRASRTGEQDHNRRLSRARAEAVSELLMSAGVPSSRIRIVARGENPRQVDDSESARERGVELMVISIDRPPNRPGPVSMPRPPDKMMFQLIRNDNFADSLHFSESITAFDEHMLNVLGPSGAGLKGLDFIFQAIGVNGIADLKDPTDDKELARIQSRTLDAVWDGYSEQVRSQGLSWTPDYRLTDASGKVVKRPFE